MALGVRTKNRVLGSIYYSKYFNSKHFVIEIMNK